MAGRRTNLALLGVLAVAFATGTLSWGIGTQGVRWVVLAHGVAGIAILVLAPWKGTIVRRGLRRARPGRALSLALVVLVTVCVATGILHATGLFETVGTFSPLGIHVAAGVGAIVVAVAHIVRRPVRPRATDLSRRNLLRAGAVTAGAGAAVLGLEGALRATGARGADRRFTGSHEVGSFEPDRMPVTQWFDDAVQEIDPSTWRLEIVRGAEVHPFTYDELASHGDRFRATLDCTGGWYAEQDWEGVRLDRLLPLVDGGVSVLVRSATGFTRRFPLDDAARLLLATHVGGEPLSPGHGSPLRLVAPGRRGFWWVKWVVRLEIDDTPWWWQPPFPLT